MRKELWHNSDAGVQLCEASHILRVGCVIPLLYVKPISSLAQCMQPTVYAKEVATYLSRPSYELDEALTRTLVLLQVTAFNTVPIWVPIGTFFGILGPYWVSIYL